MKKRVFSLFLALVMLFSLLPAAIPAAAEEDLTESAVLDEASTPELSGESENLPEAPEEIEVAAAQEEQSESETADSPDAPDAGFEGAESAQPQAETDETKPSGEPEEAVEIIGNNVPGSASALVDGYSSATSSGESGWAISADAFPDDVFRAYVSENFDSNGDGCLNDEEISNATTIDLYQKDVASLQGIEYLSKLHRVSCSYSSLTSLDVSKNIEITALSIYDSPLTSLDVRNNAALTSLTCEKTQLTSLDVSNCTALTYLVCTSNQLTSLDLSRNPALWKLGCSSNQLTSLDLTQNTALEVLVCSDNQLTSLDLSRNPALRELYCNNNQITSLDLSKNTALKYLDCSNNQLTSLDLSMNTVLNNLKCKDNQLTGLNLSKNTALESLGCSNNRLTSLNLAQNTALKDIECSDNQLNNLDLGQNTTLKFLNCSNNQLSNLDLSKTTALWDLNCSENHLISLYLSENLDSLNCSDNQLSSLDLSKTTALYFLSCESNQLAMLDLSQNTKLRGLNCSNNPLTVLDISTCLTLLDAYLTGEQFDHETYISYGLAPYLTVDKTVEILTESLPSVEYSGVLKEGNDWTLNWRCYGDIDTSGEGSSAMTLEITLNGTPKEDNILIVGESPWLGEEYGLSREDITEIVLTGTTDTQLFIAAELFKDYTELKKLTMDKIHGLGAGAFEGCTSLELVDGFDDYLIAIGNHVFRNCVSLKSVSHQHSGTLVLPKYLACIGDEVFMNTSLEGIYLMEQVDTIGENAFKGCDEELTIYCYPYTYACSYAVTNRIKYELLEEKEYSSFSVKDSWSFSNSIKHFDAREYYISQSDWNRLVMGCDSVQKRILKYYQKESWGGSCWGMAASAVLVKMGLLSPSYFKSGAETLYDITLLRDSPTESLINYYYLAQYLYSNIAAKREFRRLSDKSQLEKIEALAEAAMSGSAPFLLHVGEHAVVGYGVERGIYLKKGKFYDSKILIYDVNYPVNLGDLLFEMVVSNATGFIDTSLYFNHGTGEWYWPSYPEYNTLWQATNDPSLLAPTPRGEEKYFYTIYSASQDYYIVELDGQRHSISPGMTGEEICGILISDGNGSQNGSIITIPTSVSEYVINPSDAGSDFMIELQDALVTVECDQASSITFHPDGSFTTAEVCGNYDLSLLFNDGFYTTPWNETHIQGTADNTSISMSQTDNGVLIAGADGPVTVRVIDTAGNEEQLSYETDTDTVLVTAMPIDGEESPVVLSDEDGDGSFEHLLSVGEAVPQVYVDKEYAILSAGESLALSCSVSPEELAPYVTWSVESEEESAVITVDETGTVTAVNAGTAYAVASVELGGQRYTARCRIDVVEGEEGEEHPIAADVTEKVDTVSGVRLTASKATVELFKTDYTRIQILPELTRNYKTAQTTLLPTPAPAGDAGAAVESARFTVPAVADLFSLRVVDDRTLELIPTQAALDNYKLVKGSYPSPIAVTLDGTEFETGPLTVTVKKTEPKLTAKAVTLNSFLRDTQRVVFSGGTVLSAAPDKPLPDWLRWDSAAQSFTYLGAKDVKQSAKVTLLVSPAGWAVQRPVTVSVSAKSTAPKLSFKPASLTLKPGTGDSAATSWTLSPALFAGETVTLSRISEGKTDYANGEVLNVSLQGGSAVVTAPAVDGKAHSYKVWLSVAGKEYAFTVKTLADKQAVSLTLKAVGSIDLAVPGSPVTITASTKNFHVDQAAFTLDSICLAKTTEDLSSRFSITGSGSRFTVTALGNPQPGTYTATITADLGGETLSKSVNFTVKRSSGIPTAALSLKASGSIDVLRPGTSVTVTPTVKNRYGYTLFPDDISITRTYDGTRKAKVQEDATGLFSVAVQNGKYTITALPGAQVSHADKFSVQADVAGLSSKAVALSVKQGAARLGISSKSVTLLKTDRYSRGNLLLSVMDPSLAGIARVELDSKSKNSSLFSLLDLGGGRYAIGYAGGLITTSKAQTVKLQVYLIGNETAKPNTTLSVKVNFA